MLCLLSKLTNLFSEWKVVCFCGLGLICGHCHYLLFNWKNYIIFFMSIILCRKTKKIYINLTLCACAIVHCQEPKKGHQKVNSDRRREYFVVLCISLLVYGLKGKVRHTNSWHTLHMNIYFTWTCTETKRRDKIK